MCVQVRSCGLQHPALRCFLWHCVCLLETTASSFSCLHDQTFDSPVTSNPTSAQDAGLPQQALGDRIEKLQAELALLRSRAQLGIEEPYPASAMARSNAVKVCSGVHAFPVLCVNMHSACSS